MYPHLKLFLLAWQAFLLARVGWWWILVMRRLWLHYLFTALQRTIFQVAHMAATI